MDLNKKIFSIILFSLTILLVVNAASAATKIDQKTILDNEGDDKVVWKTYSNGKTIAIHIIKYEKKRGKWIIEDKEKIYLKKVKTNTIRIISYEYDDHGHDKEVKYRKTTLSAKNYYYKIFKQLLIREFKD